MRLFAAVDGSAEAYAAVAAALPPAGTVPGTPRWTDRRLWHVTVAFIGETPADVLPALADRLGAAAAAYRPFELAFAGTGTFPQRGHPRVLYVGVTGDVAALARLSADCRTAAGAVGAAPDQRPYHPHLTLGMWRPGEPTDPGCVPDLAATSGPPFTVTELRLYQSQYTRYDLLGAYPLGPHQA